MLVSMCAASGLDPFNDLLCNCNSLGLQRHEHLVLQAEVPWDEQLKQGAARFLADIVARMETPYDLLTSFSRPVLLDVLAKNKLAAVGSNVGVSEVVRIKKDFEEASTPALRMLLFKA